MHVAPRQSFYSIIFDTECERFIDQVHLQKYYQAIVVLFLLGSNMIWHSDQRGQLFVTIDLLDVALEYEMCRL